MAREAQPPPSGIVAAVAGDFDEAALGALDHAVEVFLVFHPWSRHDHRHAYPALGHHSFELTERNRADLSPARTIVDQ